jgi:ethanolamine utilization protein EutQ
MSAKLFKYADLDIRYSERGSFLSEYVDRRDSEHFASGVASFRDADIPFRIWYDEVISCLSTENGLDIVVDGAVHRLGAGDVLWIPKDTDLVYRSVGTSVFFYAVSPADWKERRPA